MEGEQLDFILVGHGISRSNLDIMYPLPEKAEDPGPPPLDVNFGNDFLFSPESSEELSPSGQSSTITGRFTNELFGESISSSATGENTVTGRSSVYSWGNDDEFDRKASAEVRSMFAQIDCCLFENTKHTDEMKDECSDWRKSFPYLRVLGKQLLPTEENGTEVIHSNMCEQYDTFPITNISDDEFDRSMENQILAVNGRKIVPAVPPDINTYISKEGKPQYSFLSHLNEEVFMIDGEMEEFIAFDNNSLDCRERREQHGHLKKKYCAIPPVTPHAYVHETSINDCFYHVWVEIIHILKHLLKLYTSERAKKEIEQQHVVMDSMMDGFLDSIIELPQSGDEANQVNRLPSQLRLKTASNMFTPTRVNGLKELMTIRSVALQQRAPSVAANLVRDDYPTPKDHSSSRPGSSVLGAYRQFPKQNTFRTTEHHFYDRMLSAKFPKRNSRLQPLQTPKTAGHVEDNNALGEVRGTRLQTGTDRLSPNGILNITQQLWGARNGMLPPLERADTGDTSFFLKDKHSSAKHKSRASSAVSSESKTFVLRERLKTFPSLSDSRPSTNQSYRELPYNKSIISQQSRFKDTMHASLTKPIFHQTINEQSNFFEFPPTFKTYGEDTQDFDDFILWGHGPPLISQQRRRGKTIGNHLR